MERSMFKAPNKLAQEALLELKMRLAEIKNDFNIDLGNIEPINVLQVYEISGEPNWGEEYIVITKQREILGQLLSGDRNIDTLTKNEWYNVLNPSPSNQFIFKYFKKLYNAYKTKATSNNSYESAFNEIQRILKEKYDSNQINRQ